MPGRWDGCAKAAVGPVAPAASGERVSGAARLATPARGRRLARCLPAGVSAEEAGERPSARASTPKAMATTGADRGEGADAHLDRGARASWCMAPMPKPLWWTVIAAVGVSMSTRAVARWRSRRVARRIPIGLTGFRPPTRGRIPAGAAGARRWCGARRRAGQAVMSSRSLSAGSVVGAVLGKRSRMAASRAPAAATPAAPRNAAE